MTSHEHEHLHQHEHAHQHEHSHAHNLTNDETMQRAPRTKHGEAQRQTLIEAAYQLLAVEGFEGLRTRDIAARAGVNIATLHYYFATKEDLIRAVVDHLRQIFAQFQQPNLEREPHEPLGELRHEFLDACYQVQSQSEAYIALFEIFLRSLRDPAIKTILLSMQDGWAAHIAVYLTDGIRRGIFRGDMDVPTMAQSIASLVMGSVMQQFLYPAGYSVERVLREVEHWVLP